MRFVRSFFRHIRDGFRHLFRNGWMTFASVFTMALTLFMMGGLVLFFANIQKVTTDIEQNIQVRAYIDLAANERDEAKTKADITKIPHVKGITYRTKDEELADTIQNLGEEFKQFEGDKNPFYNVFIVDVDDTQYIKEVAQAVNQLTYISKVQYGGLDAENVMKGVEVVRYALSVIAAVLVVVAILLISNTIRLTIFARQAEIEIMRLVGATNRFIRAPFAYEGAFIGILGALVAFGTLLGAYMAIQEVAGSLLGINNLSLLPLFPTLGYVGVGQLLLGIILGRVGANRSIKKFLVVNR